MRLIHLRSSEDAKLPPGTIDLRNDLVPAVRSLLNRGLTEAFMRSCVRIGGFEPFFGGFRAALVGGVTVNVNAVLKLGGDELDDHDRFLRAVNGVRSGTFPDVLQLVPLANNRRLLLMEQLVGYLPLFNYVYHRDTPLADLDKLVDKTIAALGNVQQLAPGDPRSPDLPTSADPFSDRFRLRMADIIAAAPQFAPIMTQSGLVMGQPCPPMDILIARIQEWVPRACPSARAALVHGDSHLRNILVRRYGRGYRVRLIDPNPSIGFSDPIYDAGKLLHFAEPVGFVLATPDACRSSWSILDNGHLWSLNANLENASGASERRRQRVFHRIEGAYEDKHGDGDGGGVLGAKLRLSAASAHASLAMFLAQEGRIELAGFVIAHMLRALAQWDRLVRS